MGSLNLAFLVLEKSGNLNVFNGLEHDWLPPDLTGPIPATAHHLYQSDVLSRVGGCDG